MKIAVLYTGAVRTVKDTIDSFVLNLLHNDVHVFATVQSDDTEYFTQLLQEKMGDHLKSITWFDRQDQCWTQMRERLLNSFSIHGVNEDQWKQYLRSSGSMIEHYQLYLSYLQVVGYETREKIQYDYILRIRPDVVLTKPINFSWLNLSDEEIGSRITRVQSKTGNPDLRVSLFMNSLLDSTRIDTDLISNECDIHPDDSIVRDLLSSSPDCIRKYIRNGRYILTLRNNIMYIVKRSYAYLLPCVGTMYGTFPLEKDTYWFNAENQFRMACIHSGLSLFNSTTRLEGDSLYEYDPANYYDEAGNLKKGGCLFFLRRK